MGIKKYKIVNSNIETDFNIFEEPRYNIQLTQKLIEYINEPIDDDYLSYEETLIILNTPEWDAGLNEE